MSDQANSAAKPGPGANRRVRRRASTSRPAAPSDTPARSEPRDPVRERPEPRDSYDHAEGHKDNERGVRALIASGPSQIPRITTMRTRDINRPTDEEIAAAESEVEIVRRNWKPPAR
ncbi:hypothetical protein [Antricoccus suffuscus]|uniref:hypothetical protein n=1 Tax=Antricoccus suffuscus TaxID=1629062 RepID=UPI000D079792|nr:hypothetical protein [Antricoccus suffuscus]